MKDNTSILGKIVHDVKTYQWHVIVFREENGLPAYGYTIGLFESFQHPEIIVLGLKAENILPILNLVGEFVRDRGPVKTETEYFDEFIGDYPVVFLEVKPEYRPAYLGYADWYYSGREYPILQMVWPDKEGHFPWHEGYSEALIFNQPLMDRNTDFFFYESRNLGVLTTRQVLEEQFPILAVYHDGEEDWQFLCHTTSEPPDGRIVGLECMVQRDPSLNALFDLPMGWRAVRENVGGEWVREPWESE